LSHLVLYIAAGSGEAAAGDKYICCQEHNVSLEWSNKCDAVSCCSAWQRYRRDIATCHSCAALWVAPVRPQFNTHTGSQFCTGGDLSNSLKLFLQFSDNCVADDVSELCCW